MATITCWSRSMLSEPHFRAVTLPENVSLLRLPAYSLESNLVERWFQEFRRALSNWVVEPVGLPQVALTKALERYWRDPARLRYLPVSPGGGKPSSR